MRSLQSEKRETALDVAGSAGRRSRESMAANADCEAERTDTVDLLKFDQRDKDMEGIARLRHYHRRNVLL